MQHAVLQGQHQPRGRGRAVAADARQRGRLGVERDEAGRHAEIAGGLGQDLQQRVDVVGADAGLELLAQLDGAMAELDAVAAAEHVPGVHEHDLPALQARRGAHAPARRSHRPAARTGMPSSSVCSAAMSGCCRSQSNAMPVSRSSKRCSPPAASSARRMSSRRL